MLKLNNNDFDNLNNASKDLDKEISEFNSNLSKYYDSYKKSVEDIKSWLIAFKLGFRSTNT